VPPEGDGARRTRAGLIATADIPQYTGGETKFKRDTNEASKAANSPMEFFCLLFCPIIINMIIVATNSWARAMGTDRTTFKPLNRNRLLKFIAIIVFMGHCQLPSRKHYWERGLFNPGYPEKLMSGRQFDNYVNSMIRERTDNYFAGDSVVCFA
jgi:hypothetical protein